MIKLARPAAGEKLLGRLRKKTDRLGTSPDAKAARTEWMSARTLRRDLLVLLETAAPGISRCMYCGDSQGTSVDHFEPLARTPGRTFEWTNHLLACSFCNSNAKRDRFPCDDTTGAPLLIDPTTEDPYDHLRLVFRTGAYAPRTVKGSATIEVFGLSRPTLERGRSAAFVRCGSMLRDWHGHHTRADLTGATEVRDALLIQPFADVLFAMLRQADAPGAPAVFGAEVVAALRMWNRTGGGTGQGQGGGAGDGAGGGAYGVACP